MSLRQGTLIGDILDGIPAPVVRHLTLLQCGKVALSQVIFKNSGDDSWSGAHDVAMDILGLVVDEPVEFRKLG